MVRSFSWRLKDIILVGALGLLFAFLYLGALYLGMFLQAALAPVGLSAFGIEAMYGVWFMAAVLAAYILQKPGVAFVAEMIASLLELLMGNVGGPLVLLAGLIQGLGAEAGFAMFRYRRYDALSIACSALLACAFSFAWGFVQSGYAALQPALLLAMFAVRAASALLFSGLLVKLLGDGLARTGALKGYALGAACAQEAAEPHEDAA